MSDIHNLQHKHFSHLIHQLKRKLHNKNLHYYLMLTKLYAKLKRAHDISYNIRSHTRSMYAFSFNVLLYLKISSYILLAFIDIYLHSQIQILAFICEKYCNAQILIVCLLQFVVVIIVVYNVYKQIKIQAKSNNVNDDMA